MQQMNESGAKADKFGFKKNSKCAFSLLQQRQL
jgi:hypothetical protein